MEEANRPLILGMPILVELGIIIDCSRGMLLTGYKKPDTYEYVMTGVIDSMPWNRAQREIKPDDYPSLDTDDRRAHNDGCKKENSHLNWLIPEHER